MKTPNSTIKSSSSIRKWTEDMDRLFSRVYPALESRATGRVRIQITRSGSSQQREPRE